MFRLQIVDRLDVSGVVISATFVDRDHDRGGLPELFVGLHLIDNAFGERLEQVDFGRGGWLSLNVLGFTNDTDGKFPSAMAS